MHELVAADHVEILILVDNATDFLSSSPDSVESELSRFWRRGARLQAGPLLCCAAHGFSCSISAWSGATVRTLLFDSGPDGSVLTRNVSLLGFDMGSVDALFLSHGHWDHAGGMLDALDLIRRVNGKTVPTYMHPDMYRSRAMKAPDGSMRQFADIPTPTALEQHGATVMHATAPQTVLDDLFLISGEIPRITPFEKGMPGQHRRTSDGAAWEPDPLVMDERFVAVRVKDKGAFVFTACSHAGAVNVLAHARTLLPNEALHGVMGGFHLAGTTERAIPETVEAMRVFDLQLIAPAHCTGWRAVGALVAAFGEAVVPSAVGTTYRI